MIGLSKAKFWRIACSQNVDFPDPGGPTSKIRFLDGTSCNWARDKKDPLSFTVKISINLLVRKRAISPITCARA
jgi:hypothetical protein